MAKIRINDVFFELRDENQRLLDKTTVVKAIEDSVNRLTRVVPLSEDVNTPELANGEPKVIINDTLDELRDENKRNTLLSEDKKMSYLLGEYRKCLLNYHKSCECNQKSGNNVVIECLESLYKNHFKEEEINENENSEQMPKKGRRDVPKDVEREMPHKDSNNLITEEESTSRQTPQQTLDKAMQIQTQGVSLLRKRKSARLSSKLAALSNSLTTRAGHSRVKCDYENCGIIFENIETMRRHKQHFHPSITINPVRSTPVTHNNRVVTFNKKTKEINTYDLPLKSFSETNDNDIDSESDIQKSNNNNNNNNYNNRLIECFYEKDLREKMSEQNKQIPGKDVERGMVDIESEKLMLRKGRPSETLTLQAVLGCESNNIQSNRDRDFSNESKTIDRRVVNIVLCDYEGCSRIFKSKISLSYHKRFVHVERKFQCDFHGCKKVFKLNDHLNKHKQSHLKKYVCYWPYCTKRFSFKQLLENHLRKHENIRPYECFFDGCVKAYGIKDLLNQHIRRVHESKPIPFNSITFSGSGGDHKYDEVDNVKSAKIATNYIQLNSTSEDTTNDTDIDSAESNIVQPMGDNSLNKFINDLTVIDTTAVNRLLCNYEGCAKSLKNLKSLKEHRMLVHGERKFRCDFLGCKRAFSRNDRLESHKTTHSAAKDFVCTIKGCSKRFKTKKILKAHKQSHLKRYVCCWPCCTERFTFNYLLDNHMRKHQNIRPYKCYIDGCVKEFCTKDLLGQHIRGVHKSKPIPFNSM